MNCPYLVDEQTTLHPLDERAGVTEETQNIIRVEFFKNVD